MTLQLNRSIIELKEQLDSELTTEEIILKYMYYVEKQAKIFINKGVPESELDQLISLGNEVLFLKAKDYNSSKNKSFLGYAKKRIIGIMQDYCRKIDDIPWRHRVILKEIYKMEATGLEIYNLDLETLKELLSNKYSVEVIRKALELKNEKQYLNLYSEDNFENQIFFEDLKEKILELFNDEVNKKIIELFFYRGEKLREIGETLKLSESAISQRLKKIKSEIKKNFLRDDFII